MDREELVSKLQGLSGEYAQLLRSMGAHEPDWDPLEKVLPLKWCGGFMFMGYTGDIRIYKHGLTRHYLHIDHRGKTYWYDADAEEYYPVPKKKAVDAAFDCIQEMGYKRTTKCTPEVMAERRRRLEEAGYTIVTMSPDDA